VLTTKDGQVHRYQIEKISQSGAESEIMSVDLSYKTKRGKLRLQSVSLPQEIAGFEGAAAFGDPKMMAMAADDICNAGVSLSLFSGEEDINPAQLEHLPSRAEVFAMMGAPSVLSAERGALVYEYRVLGAASEEPSIRMTLWFDEAGTKPLRIETRYREIYSMADFERGKLRYSYDV
jgi:hypothetical protein